MWLAVFFGDKYSVILIFVVEDVLDDLFITILPRLRVVNGIDVEVLIGVKNER